ncbi:MAG: hypothetical protein PHZ19_02180 [Candidatus Thermoplasmatota archaeon]|nr:hypothetical protein [Candidatus Thermoplasmatota archaeon]
MTDRESGRIASIPFNGWSRQALLERGKMCTSRRERKKEYGEVGDYFYVVDRHRIKAILRLPLWFVKEFLYQTEGARSPEEFVAVWETIHTKTGYVPEQEVWVYFFSNPQVRGSDEKVYPAFDSPRLVRGPL